MSLHEAVGLVIIAIGVVMLWLGPRLWDEQERGGRDD